MCTGTAGQTFWDRILFSSNSQDCTLPQAYHSAFLQPGVPTLLQAASIPTLKALALLSVCLQVHYLHRPIALWCGLNHSLVLSQTSDFSKELLGCGCGAGGRLPGWPKGSASFVKLHIKVRAGSGKRAFREGRAIEPGGPQGEGVMPQRACGGQRTACENWFCCCFILGTKRGRKCSHLTGLLSQLESHYIAQAGLNLQLFLASLRDQLIAAAL